LFKKVTQSSRSTCEEFKADKANRPITLDEEFELEEFELMEVLHDSVPAVT